MTAFASAHSRRQASGSIAPVLEASALLGLYCSVRQQSLALCVPLTPEDMMVQSSPEASPTKWHIAHTTWFFETFVLREFSADYQPFDSDYLWLFNSYYNGVSAQPEKKLRASFSRPSLDQVIAYRRHVDAAIESLFVGAPHPEAMRRLELGLHHEQQHQELLVTDLKHALWSNPLRPAYRDLPAPEAGSRITPQRWCSFEGGLVEIGHSGPEFCFDNEEPRHQVYLEAFALATRPVSCAEYLQFIEDGGYSRAELWLSEGWRLVEQENWRAPLYWRRSEATESAPPTSAWTVFTLRGEQPLNTLLASPVCHLSYFEADAFARWAGCRLPTEAEWETAAAHTMREARPGEERGDLLEGGTLHPLAAVPPGNADQPGQLLGGVWEWTASAYLGYPGYRALPGALGEYNGKFMSGQMVLRGGSVATPASHIRPTYRNFFPPATRWQFSGLRLARR